MNKKNDYKLLRFSFVLFSLLSLFACSSDDSTDDSTDDDVETEEEYIVIDRDEVVLIEGTDVDETTLGFAEGNVEVQLVEIDGTEYYQVYTSNQISLPVDYDMGPWCAYDVDDDTDEEGGIWIDNEHGEVYQVTYDFLDTTVNELYSDSDEDDAYWDAMIDGDNVNYTNSRYLCINAAVAVVEEEYWSQCVECLPEYFEDETIEEAYYFPVTPVKLDQPSDIQGTQGIALNGVIFDGSAPVDDIISYYTIAAFDDAGGHINPFVGYHYHTNTGLTYGFDEDDDHRFIGYALDGYKIYEHDETLTDLDDCNGHDDDDLGYHYHISDAATNENLPCFYGQTATTGGGR
jgi:hypothetical protein